jgi:hypothetical protein
MAKYIVLHDQRLGGSAPQRRSITNLTVNASISLFGLFPVIRALGQLDGPQGLYVLCHGYAGINNSQRVCTDAGGMGLQLGREGVLHSNVSRWSELRGAFSSIVVYSCAAADTQWANRGTAADGQYLMGALALYTNATVYAADRIQWYRTAGGAANGTIDFGAWEGTLWKFEPNGLSSPVQGNRVPTELGQA